MLWVRWKTHSKLAHQDPVTPIFYSTDISNQYPSCFITSLPHNLTDSAEQTQNETAQMLRTMASVTSVKMHSQGWHSLILKKPTIEMHGKKNKHAKQYCIHWDRHRKRQKHNTKGKENVNECYNGSSLRKIPSQNKEMKSLLKKVRLGELLSGPKGNLF